MVLPILSLAQNCPYHIVARITHDFKGEIPIWGLYDGSQDECFLQDVESSLTLLVKNERGILS
jgi:hypothetical protein